MPVITDNWHPSKCDWLIDWLSENLREIFAVSALPGYSGWLNEIPKCFFICTTNLRYFPLLLAASWCRWCPLQLHVDIHNVCQLYVIGRSAYSCVWYVTRCICWGDLYSSARCRLEHTGPCTQVKNSYVISINWHMKLSARYILHVSKSYHIPSS